MEARLDVITLAVADIERALAFYRALGLESKGIIGTEWTDETTGAKGAIAMFKLGGGLILNLYPRPISPRTRRFRSGHRRAASSASRNSSAAATPSTICWRGRRAPAPRSRPPTTGHGGSTPATSAIPTATSGKSFRTRRREAPRRQKRPRAFSSCARASRRCSRLAPSAPAPSSPPPARRRAR